MILENSPWRYNEIELSAFVNDATRKHRDELIELYKRDMDAFNKKFRGIALGVWQKYGAYGRISREEMDRIIKGYLDFFIIENDL